MTGCIAPVLAATFVFPFLAAPVWAKPAAVSLVAADGRRLAAVYAPPSKGKGMVVCLHGLGAQKEEWAPLLARLEKEGWGYLAYDARGHGDSSQTRSAEGYPDEWRRFGPPGRGSPWRKMIDDAGAAVAFLAKSDVPRTSVVLAGASLGANVALNYAALSSGIGGAVLLSPGLNYQGIETLAVAERAGALPVLLVASRADGYAFQSAKALASRLENGRLLSDVPPGHGVQMLDEKTIETVFRWMAR